MQTLLVTSGLSFGPYQLNLLHFDKLIDTFSAIEVFPAQPQASIRFAINVYVENVGQAASGEYDSAIFIKDVSRDAMYPAGTFRREALKPRENVAAYFSIDRMANDPGSYQVHVEIRSFLFEDGNTKIIRQSGPLV